MSYSPPPEFAAHINLREFTIGITALFGAASGIGLVVGTGLFIGGGMTGNQEVMDGGGSVLYVSGAIGSAALYGLNRFVRQDEQGPIPPPHHESIG